MAARIGVDVEHGLDWRSADELLARDGPNVLPEEAATPGWRKLVDEPMYFVRLTASVLTPATFDSKQMNWVALGQFVLAVLTTQMDASRSILGTVDISTNEFAWALLPPVVLLAAWEAGNYVLRRVARE